MESRHETYYNIGIFFGVVAFIISYVYCVKEYGYLFGVGLGWLPSAIVGVVTYIFWAFVVGVGLIYYANTHHQPVYIFVGIASIIFGLFHYFVE